MWGLVEYLSRVQIRQSDGFARQVMGAIAKEFNFPLADVRMTTSGRDVEIIVFVRFRSDQNAGVESRQIEIFVERPNGPVHVVV